ncbi:hypothetical protein T11_17430 [Trichinella zimbabwensis]|uniref:Uncharacterized protein n=1 Tax=Trichinella zimbabwensis TaxID=268475 RepID=A0A0V1H2A3_9BILA|nr:hypothetical protein T11_17430 [Trichinella zimbabwensis]
MVAHLQYNYAAPFPSKRLHSTKFLCDFETALIPVILGNFPTPVCKVASSAFAKLCFGRAPFPSGRLDSTKFLCDFETALIPVIQGNFPTPVCKVASSAFAKLCFGRSAGLA